MLDLVSGPAPAMERVLAIALAIAILLLSAIVVLWRRGSHGRAPYGETRGHGLTVTYLVASGLFCVGTVLLATLATLFTAIVVGGCLTGLYLASLIVAGIRTARRDGQQ